MFTCLNVSSACFMSILLDLSVVGNLTNEDGSGFWLILAHFNEYFVNTCSFWRCRSNRARAIWCRSSAELPARTTLRRKAASTNWNRTARRCSAKAARRASSSEQEDRQVSDSAHIVLCWLVTHVAPSWSCSVIFKLFLHICCSPWFWHRWYLITQVLLFFCW